MPAESDSQERPADHTTAEATPNTDRAASSDQKSGATACPMHEITSSQPPASVTRRDPSRSAATPPGIEPATIARLDADRSTPEPNPERPKSSL